MTDDPRCCGSGMCIIDGEGRCWCGQQWDGQKMCAPPPLPAASVSPGTEPAAPEQAGADSNPPGATRRLLALAALAAPLAALLPQPSPARAAAGFTRAEIQAMQAVVQAQLKALAAGDAASAYAQASPAIQQQFGDAARFMAMVREAYPMLIGPRDPAFRVPEREAAGAVLPLQLRDQAGRAWLATYRLEPQAAGGWRIGGCIVTADAARLSA